ncbi:MAG: AzlD domain-containing protein [Treponema sp.]|nr:AzlD domain-containing protein [Treponema sp.]
MVSAAIIFGERLFPFALFSRKDPPEIIRFIEKYIPSLVIAMLIVYCLKDVQPASLHSALPPAAGIAAALAFQLLTKNSMISIFGSTALFMFLSHVL